MPTTVIERWYVQMAYNNKNSPAFVDLVADMASFGNGTFTATFKLNDGVICDYTFIESEAYVDTTTSKAY